MFVRELAAQVPTSKMLHEGDFLGELLKARGPASDEMSVAKDRDGNMVTVTVHCNDGKCKKATKRTRIAGLGSEPAREGPSPKTAARSTKDAVQEMAKEMRHFFAGPGGADMRARRDLSGVLRDLLGGDEGFPIDGDEDLPLDEG